jgi:predicted extracellular nuclease
MKTRHAVFNMFFAMALVFGLVSIAMPAQAVSPDIVISQVYGGGGNSGATYKNDFIELFNRGTTTVSLSGWSVQYASSSGTSWSKTNLTSFSLAPGQYYLIQEAAGAGGTVSLPTPDATGTIAMSATGAKVALVNNQTLLTGSGCPFAATVVDFVGYDGANCSETSPTPTLSNTTAALRKAGGATDTDNNAGDFDIGTPTPHNSSTNPFGYGVATPSTPFPGASTLLTVVVIPGYLPPSTGLTVSCNLSAIGGSATQVFYDDGTNGDVAAGDNTFSYSTTVADNTTSGAKSLPCTISDTQARSASLTIGLSVGVLLPIGTVNGPVLDTDNGATHVSPYVGQTVTVRGVIYEKTLQAISNSTNTYKGFYLQNTTAYADGNPNTSDGLFVFMNTPSTIGGYTPQVGDEVIIAGSITEYFNMTEMQNPNLAVVQVARSGVNIDAEVAPVVANPPANLADANRYWERLQGMRVQVPQNSIVLGGRNVFNPADAEIWLARPDSAIALRADPYARRAFRDAHPLDDNYDPVNWDGNGYRILMGSLGIKAAAGDAQALIAPARSYSTLTNAPAGGLNYTFSKYRIEISEQATFSEGVDPAANNPPEVFDRSIHYSIVDYNLENLYDYRDNPFSGCDFAGNAGCARVDPFLAAINPPYDYVPASDAAYQARLNDIALEIINDLHNPDILMVQEVENQDICTVSGGALTCGTTDNADGKPDVLQELALKIASLGGPAYDAAFDRNSSDLRGIAPAFLYRTDRVQLLPPAGDPILGTDPAIVYAGATVPANNDVSNPKTFNAALPVGFTGACETSWVFPRAPDVALFRIYSTAIGVGSHRDVYVINNHFKSGPDTCVAHRTEQAKYNAALVAYIQAANPNARIVVGGDLNVYPRPDDPFAPIGQPASSDQLGSLYDPGLGLTNLWDVLLAQAPEAAYSYVYIGMAQTLDQVFVNQLMLTDLQQYRIAHINSDFSADYPGDVARGTSDHDPNVGAFVINDPPIVDAGGPYTVNEGSSVTLTATGTDPENGPLTYAWDLDNNGTFESPGQSVDFAGVDGPATFTVNVRVTDNGGLTAVASTIVTVNNVAPVVNAGPDAIVLEGSTFTRSGSFTDPGADTWTATVDYGDGSGVQPLLLNDKTFVLSHVYANEGIYTVVVTVTDDDGGVGTDTVTVVVPKLTLAMSADPATYSYQGQVIVYTYVTTNAGDVTLSGPFMISDNRLGTFQCGSATSLAPGDSVTCTKSYTILWPDDMNAKTITNRATVTGQFGDTVVPSNQAKATITHGPQTSKITPTSVTCSQFAGGGATDLIDTY